MQILIDDLSIKSGFYECAALGIICVPMAKKAEVNCIGSAFVCAENMVHEAYDFGISSCIVGRAEDTFLNPEMKALLTKWGLEESYMTLVFVCLGYIDGEYLKIKPRNDGRAIYIEKAN